MRPPRRPGALLAEAAWLSPSRALAYGRLLLAATMLGGGGWVALSHGGLDPAGKPLGTDFTSFWAASSLALAGHPADAYVPPVLAAAEQALFPAQPQDRYAAFFYPPTYLLVCLPLALLPYLASLAAWLALTFVAYWRGIRGLLPGLALPVAAYPAVLINAGHGQNAFLTTALFAGAAHWLCARPLLAGACLGGLVVKPHLVLIAPIALLAGRHWRALAGFVATAGGLALLSWACFGSETWRGFRDIAPQARTALEQGLVGPAKMPSVFAAVRLLGLPLQAAYAVQAAAALAAAALAVAALLVTRRRARDGGGQVALLVTATLLATPFLLDYDLTILAVPLAWTLREALRTGFLRWEKLALAAGFMLPLLCRTAAAQLALPLGPPVIAAVLALVVRRLLQSCTLEAAWHATPSPPPG